MDERAKYTIDTTHMPANIAWIPDAKDPTSTGTLAYRRSRLTIAYHIIITIVLNVFVILVLDWNVGIILKKLDTSPTPVMEIIGLTVCGLVFIAMGLFFVYRCVKIVTDRIALHISPAAIDCVETYCRTRNSHHFPIDEELKIERYVAMIGRNREFYSLVIKSGKTIFPFGTLAPPGLRWLESTLNAYIEAYRPGRASSNDASNCETPDN